MTSEHNYSASLALAGVVFPLRVGKQQSKSRLPPKDGLVLLLSLDN